MGAASTWSRMFRQCGLTRVGFKTIPKSRRSKGLRRRLCNIAAPAAAKETPMLKRLALSGTLVVGAGLGIALVPAQVSAHHAFAAEFDANQPVKFEKATVTRMEWVNPHVWIHVDVALADGTIEKWAIEAGTPNVLFRRGFTKEALLPGTRIVVEGYRSKDGSRRANGRDLTLPDGTTLFLGSSGTGAPTP
jgi:hypothetical protein